MTPADRADASRPKATLFCHACRHESPVRGDWEVRSDGEWTTTSCPACGVTVDERPVDLGEECDDRSLIRTTTSQVVKVALAPLHAPFSA